MNLDLAAGRYFLESEARTGQAAAVIGWDVKDELSPQLDPVGRSNDNLLIIPITTFDEQYPEMRDGGGDTIHIATIPRRPEDIDALIEQETADIAIQFLAGAVTLTGVGGLLGIAFGLGIELLARVAFDFEAAAPLWSVSSASASPRRWAWPPGSGPRSRPPARTRSRRCGMNDASPGIE